MTLRIGIHSPVQGATSRFVATATALAADCYLWLTSEKPADAIPYASAQHFIRLDNWEAGELTAEYVARVTPTITAWQGTSNAVYVCGNESDLEMGHDGERFPDIAAALRAAFAGIRLANPPLSVEATHLLTPAVCDAADVVCCHAYIDWQHPETLTNPNLGQAYRYALAVAGGRPVIVTEMGVSNFDGVHWSDRNRLIADWIAQADADGVSAVCLFIADGIGTEWASFDLGPEAAAEIRSLVAPPTPTPPPPEPESQMPYDATSSPLTHVAAASANWYARAPRAVVDAYSAFAPQIGYDPNLALAQSAIETGWWTSVAYIVRRNMAGVGITGDNVAGPTWDTAEQGVQAHLALLNCYYSDGMDPWGQLTRFGFGGFTKGFTRLNQMNGVWAVPGTTYGEDIAALANSVVGSEPQPQPEPTPAPNFTDLDNRMAEEAMRHVGETMMGPGQPLDDGNGSHSMSNWCEAGAETVAAIVTGVRFRFPSAYVHYLSLLAGGHIDPDPDTAQPGEFDFWGPYSDGDGHITIRGTDGLTYGTSFVPDVWIGRPVNYYGSYLGHAVSEAVLQVAADWQPQEEDVLPNLTNAWDDGLLQAVWQSLKAPVYNPKTKKWGAAKPIVYNPQAGFFHEWVQRLRASQAIGVPCTQEQDWGDGRVTQTFTSGRMMEFNRNDGSLTVK